MYRLKDFAAVRVAVLLVAAVFVEIVAAVGAVIVEAVELVVVVPAENFVDVGNSVDGWAIEHQDVKCARDVVAEIAVAVAEIVVAVVFLVVGEDESRHVEYRCAADYCSLVNLVDNENAMEEN